MVKKEIALYFIGAALVALLAGLLFGIIGGFQYIIPEFLKEHFSFDKTRPVHVTLVITWIFTAAVGGIYFYLPKICNRPLFSRQLALLHLLVLIFTGVAILCCYAFGIFGGREYLEFPPILALPMLFSWLLLMINYFKTLNINITKWPVYLWMWATGLIFFLLTFGEAYLWTMPFFGHNITRDITVQWKAMGAMVGSWNMLVYGTGFFVMEKISGNKDIANSKITFFFYFLGLTNLMFNWGHHTYILPAAPWVKNVSYIISMTELLILGNIIRNWQRSVSDAKKSFHLLPYRFLAAADIWIFLNLILAIVISIPAVNYYTHGTHITVAHAMGATIGINTMILFASLFYIADRNSIPINSEKVNYGFWITNISLLIFWFSLIGAGIVKAVERTSNTVFQQMMQKLSPWFHAFTVAGIGVFVGIIYISISILTFVYKSNLSTSKLLLKETVK